MSLKIGWGNAWLFMSVFILQMALMLFVGRNIRRRSHIPGTFKRTPLEKLISPLANLVWLAALVYSVFLPLLFGTAWFAAGLCVFLLGLAVLLVASHNFMTTPPDRVIQKGVYSLSRHPMYLATFLICLGAGVAAASWTFVLLSVVMAAVFYGESLVEEKFCLQTYGEPYREYMKRVPRWVGIPRSIRR